MVFFGADLTIFGSKQGHCPFYCHLICAFHFPALCLGAAGKCLATKGLDCSTFNLDVFFFNSILNLIRVEKRLMQCPGVLPKTSPIYPT